MASIVKEVTSGSATYGPWHQFYLRQLQAGQPESSMNDPRNMPSFTPEPPAKPTNHATQTDAELDMNYNNYYQRLLSGGSMRGEDTQLVGQSLSAHRSTNSGPPLASRPCNNSGLIQPGLAAPGMVENSNAKPPGTARPPTANNSQPVFSGHNIPPIPMEDNDSQDPGEPVCRAGRLGAPWRHVRQCTGNQGNHICFIDGNVKQNDLNSYPPYGYQSPQPISQRFPSPVMSNNLPAVSSTKYTTSYNNHAKKGFKYWYEEKKGLPGAKQTISGKLMKMGVGY